MWDKRYQDYLPWESIIKEQVASGQGIIGCEMHEINGWGNEFQEPVSKKRRGIFFSLLVSSEDVHK